MPQNRSSAIFSQRHETLDSLDDFPTPPWATRALMELRQIKSDWQRMTCLEPACGRGTMSIPLLEYFGTVDSSDVYDHGYGDVQDFLSTETPLKRECYDWVITNPPFKMAEEFINKGLQVSKVGTAMLCRTVFIESIGRYKRLFSKTPPSFVAQFSERVPIIKGRLDERATTATGYAWLIWDKRVQSKETRLIWIPPCRKTLSKIGDYDIGTAK